MAILYITEYTALTPAGTAVEPAVAEQTVAIGATTAPSSAFNTQTSAVRISTDAICSVKFGTTPVATTGSKRMAIGESFLVSVPANKSQKVAVIVNT